MKQQTAVEWLLQQIENKNGKEFSSYYQEFVEQAKTMEKEQIMIANQKGYVDGARYFTFGMQPKSSEEYYNETYSKQEKL